MAGHICASMTFDPTVALILQQTTLFVQQLFCGYLIKHGYVKLACPTQLPPANIIISIIIIIIIIIIILFLLICKYLYTSLLPAFISENRIQEKGINSGYIYMNYCYFYFQLFSSFSQNNRSHIHRPICISDYTYLSVEKCSTFRCVIASALIRLSSSCVTNITMILQYQNI